MQLLPVIFNVPAKNSVYSSQALREHSVLPLCFGQPNRVVASSSQLEVSTSKINLQSRTPQHTSGVPLNSGKKDIVGAFSRQFQRSASDFSLQKPTSGISQQTATQFPPSDDCRGLFHSTSVFHQWHLITSANPHVIQAVCNLVSTNWKLSQSLPVTFKAPKIEPSYSSRHQHPSRLSLSSAFPDTASSSQLPCSTK